MKETILENKFPYHLTKEGTGPSELTLKLTSEENPTETVFRVIMIDDQGLGRYRHEYELVETTSKVVAMMIYQNQYDLLKSLGDENGTQP